MRKADPPGRRSLEVLPTGAMCGVTRFSSKEIVPLLKKARIFGRADAATRSKIHLVGWTISSVDPSRILALFGSLKVKDGFKFGVYQYVALGNGNAYVMAMPAESHNPEPTGLLDRPPRAPEGALRDFMEAVEGDGSPWSYMSASLACRELQSIGAMWHGIRWHTHKLIFGDPTVVLKISDGGKTGIAGDDQSLRSKDWHWLEEMPRDWRPQVLLDGGKARVIFYTYSGLQFEALYRHEDIFERGSYCFKTNMRFLARGPAGYVF